MERIRFHFDPICPWCYQTSRWAKRLEQLGEIELDWGLFSLEVVNAAEGTDLAGLQARSGPALRTAIVIRDQAGRAAIGPYYTALGRRIWEQSRPEPDMATAVRGALVELHLDAAWCDEALADPATWDAVLDEHNALVERTHSFGVPTIILDGGDGPAIFGPVISALPSDEDALELWRHVTWLVRHESFSELKRDRPSPPQLPAMDWYRAQRQAERAR
jgi:predicted DsbA family dithiol-disulfide isomerase